MLKTIVVCDVCEREIVGKNDLDMKSGLGNRKQLGLLLPPQIQAVSSIENDKGTLKISFEDIAIFSSTDNRNIYVCFGCLTNKIHFYIEGVK